MISLNHFPILIAAVLFPGAIASAAEEDSAPQTKQTRYEQLAVHAVRRLLFDDAESARALDRYYGHSERESRAEASAMAEARTEGRDWRRGLYSAMETSKQESVRARYFRNIDAVMANGECELSGSEPLPAPGTGVARRKVTVTCSFADITIPEETRQTTRSRRERLDLMADAAARAVTSEPTRRFEHSIELYRPRVPETAKWKVDSGSLVRFADVMHEEAFEQIEKAAFYRTRDSVHPEDMGGMSVQAVGQLILDSSVQNDRKSYRALTRYQVSVSDEPFDSAFDHLVQSGQRALNQLSEGLSQIGYGPLPVLATLPGRVRESRCTVTDEEPAAFVVPTRSGVRVAASCLVPLPPQLTAQDTARLRDMDPEARMAAFTARYTHPTKSTESRTVTASIALIAGNDRWERHESINAPAIELMEAVAKHVRSEVTSLFDDYDACCQGMGH
ncbi:hypothetical protein ABE473_01455 [Stenotrophomonas sp. TWI700]|uniref:hypothetical protein n=1 Tax=Stenotrophomonas sp. TWI700 TaxID=3136792 RepID=UPI003207FD76